VGIGGLLSTQFLFGLQLMLGSIASAGGSTGRTGSVEPRSRSTTGGDAAHMGVEVRVLGGDVGLLY
jgi:hypothetical protein